MTGLLLIPCSLEHGAEPTKQKKKRRKLLSQNVSQHFRT
jgi:hypothetical protein